MTALRSNASGMLAISPTKRMSVLRATNAWSACAGCSSVVAAWFIDPEPPYPSKSRAAQGFHRTDRSQANLHLQGARARPKGARSQTQ